MLTNSHIGTAATRAGAATEPAVLTVILPVFNQERYVSAAVHSVLSQTYANFELLVIDDGSTDATPKILDSIKDSRLRVIRNNHLGFIHALRTGIEHARTPWLARMDSDDISAPHRFETQMAFLAAHPECVFVGSVFGIVTPNDRFLAPVEQFEWRALTALDITFATVSFADPSTIFSRRVALDSGLYDESFPKNEKPLWYKMLSRGMGAVLGEPLHYVRWRLGSLSRTEMSKGWLDNRDIRRAYDTKSTALISHRVPPTERRAKLSAAARCQFYYLLAGDLDAAREVASATWREAPASSESWKLLLRSTLGRPMLRGSVHAAGVKPQYRPVARPW
jgi:hypothetical protein